MFKPGKKSKQFSQFLFPNYVQIFKKMTKDGLAWQYHSHKKRKDSLETRAVFSSVLILT